MFTLGTFSAFFWTLATIILFMLIFEEKFLALEEKYDRKREMKKRAKAKAQAKSRTAQKPVKRLPAEARINERDGRVSRNFAA